MNFIIVLRRIKGLIYKEILQIFRDPSSLLIAFILPIFFLFLYGYGLSLDMNNINFGIVMEDTSPISQSLARSFMNSKYYNVKTSHNRKIFEDEIISGKIKGFIIIPQDFSKKLNNKGNIAPIQLITDGSDPNTAHLIQNYTQTVWQNWLIQQSHINPNNKGAQLINMDSRVWFNSELKSTNTLIPGIIAIVMAIVGTLLTALVIAREWERGTMESIMVTPVSITEIILGKIIPYFILGMFSMFLTVVTSILMFNIPFRGSIIWFIVLSSLFMFVSLFLGLLISTVAKNQFVASTVSIVTAFLPTMMLSGFLFEISSMPPAIRLISSVIPATYFISGIRSLFLAGNVVDLFISDSIKMFIIGLFLFLITAKKTVKRLD